MINNKERKDEIKILIYIIIAFLFVIWLCTPPGNKFLQICFWGNNTQMIFAKITKQDTSKEYIFHRNNAVYLAKMYPNNIKKAIIEIDNAIRIFPSYLPDSDLKELYRDRAILNMCAGKYSSALNDFIQSGEIKYNDYIRMALVLKEQGNLDYAERYCNAILNQNIEAYAGYACLSEVYKAAGKPEIAVNIWTLAIDRKNTNARFYIDRAKVKQIIGDNIGYKEDIDKATQLDKNINLNESFIEEILHPKIIPLEIK